MNDKQPVILVVEDDDLTRSLICTALERMANFKAISSLDPEEIINIIKNGGADLVFMDVSLAGVWLGSQQADGVKLTRLLKENPETARVPIVLISAFAAPGNAEQLLRDSGADGYISKPVDLKAMVAYLQSMLDRSSI